MQLAATEFASLVCHIQHHEHAGNREQQKTTWRPKKKTKMSIVMDFLFKVFESLQMTLTVSWNERNSRQ